MASIIVTLIFISPLFWGGYSIHKAIKGREITKLDRYGLYALFGLCVAIVSYDLMAPTDKDILAENKALKIQIAELKNPTPKKETKVVEAEPPKVSTPEYSEWDKKWLAADDRAKFNLVVSKQEITGISLCKTMGKMGSKYPTKIDWDWGFDTKKVWWTDGTDVNRGKFTVLKSGEAMNGFGMMLPFTVECNYAVNIKGADLHPTTVYWISGGKKTELMNLPAPDINVYKGKVYTPKKVAK
jgi:hypothetical protein